MNFIELNAFNPQEERPDKQYYRLLVKVDAVNALKDRGIWCTLFTNRFEYTITQPYEEVKAILKSFENK